MSNIYESLSPLVNALAFKELSNGLFQITDFEEITELINQKVVEVHLNDTQSLFITLTVGNITSLEKDQVAISVQFGENNIIENMVDMVLFKSYIPLAEQVIEQLELIADEMNVLLGELESDIVVDIKGVQEKLDKIQASDENFDGMLEIYNKIYN